MLTTRDKERVKALKKRITHLLQTQFIAGGDNEDLKARCNALAGKINEIEQRNERGQAA